MQQQIDNAIDEAKAFPGRLQSQAQAKVNELVEDSKAKVDETISDIRGIPGRIRDDAKQRISDTITDAQDKVKKQREKLDEMKKK